MKHSYMYTHAYTLSIYTQYKYYWQSKSSNLVLNRGGKEIKKGLRSRRRRRKKLDKYNKAIIVNEFGCYIYKSRLSQTVTQL